MKKLITFYLVLLLGIAVSGCVKSLQGGGSEVEQPEIEQPKEVSVQGSHEGGPLGASVFRVPQGGTGAATFSSGECLVGNGTGAITTQACGSGGGGSGLWQYNSGTDVLEPIVASTSDTAIATADSFNATSNSTSSNFNIVTISDSLRATTTLDTWAQNSTVNLEFIEDSAGAFFTGNTETLITATYQDADGTVDLVVTDTLSSFTNDAGFITDISGHTLGQHSDVNTTTLAIDDVLYWTGTEWARTATSTWDTDTTLSQEQVEDFAGGMVTGNTETLIAVTYQDADGTTDFVVTDTLSSYTNDSGFITDINAHTLGQHSDVNTTSIAISNILMWDGDEWVDMSTSTFAMEYEIDTEAEFSALLFDVLAEAELDSEAELEAQLADVTNVFTNNDGALADDDLTNNTLDDLSQTTLSDPGADQLMFWDDSDTAFEFISTLTNLSITGNTLAVSDSFLLIAGDSSSGDFTWTGGHDYSGSSGFEIPNGTAPVVNAAGEIAFDTTDNQLLLGDSGDTARVVGRATDDIWKITISSTSPAFIQGGLLPVPTLPDGYTITRIQCHVVGGTSKGAAVEDASGNSSEEITCATTNTTDDGSITNPTYTASELSFIDFGATSGAVDYVSISVFGQWTRE